MCNPADIQLLENIKINHKSSKRCSVCQTNVHYLSKHCSTCEKCISGFDHHCKALNNCIGSRNYANFFLLITFLEALLILQISYGIVYCSFYIQKDELWSFSIFLMIEIIIEAILVVINGLLLFFHCWLKKHKITTYDYIVDKKKTSRSVTPSIADQYVVNSPPNREINLRASFNENNN